MTLTHCIRVFTQEVVYGSRSDAVGVSELSECWSCRMLDLVSEVMSELSDWGSRYCVCIVSVLCHLCSTYEQESSESGVWNPVSNLVSGKMCPVVSGMSGGVRWCPGVRYWGWTPWTLTHVRMSDLCPVMSGCVRSMSGECPVQCPVVSNWCPEHMSGMSGNVRKNVQNVQSGLSILHTSY